MNEIVERVLLNNKNTGRMTNNQDKNENLERIDIGIILQNAILNNKIIIMSILPLFIGYYLQDTIFTQSVAAITSDIPGFVKDIDAKKVLIILLPYLVAVVLFYISNVISTKTISKIELDTISELTEKLIESIKTSKKTINVNDLMIHIKKIYDTKNIYTITVMYIIPTVIVAIGLIYNFIKSDRSTGLWVILILIMMMLITTKLEIDSIGNAYNTEAASNNLFDEIHEVMTNIDSVITANTKDFEMQNVDMKCQQTYAMSCISEFNNSNTTYGLQVISISAMIGINYMSYKLYSQGRIDAPSFTSTVLLSLLFMDYYNYCIHAIGDLITSLGRYYETRQYFYDFMIDNSSEKERERMIELKTTRNDITFKDITLKYENKTVFNKFNLKIKGGTVNGLMGPIGSGKTTMLKMMAGIVDYEGDILIDNQNLKQSTYESIVEHIAYIPQHPKLFNRTVYYNINYGSSYTKDEISKKLAALGLTPFIDSLAEKLDTVVGKEGNKLSGGQKQFVSLIRAIIQNKTIFLLDEPSSSLDTVNKNIFINLIKNIKDKTIIISTHDKQIKPLFDRIINIGKHTDDKQEQSKKSSAYSQNQYIVEFY
jgi:ABC-type bacteriocin/lantibiotic exporter with double-glycine peptidase domain